MSHRHPAEKSLLWVKKTSFTPVTWEVIRILWALFQDQRTKIIRCFICQTCVFSTLSNSKTLYDSTPLAIGVGSEVSHPTPPLVFELFERPWVLTGREFLVELSISGMFQRCPRPGLASAFGVFWDTSFTGSCWTKSWFSVYSVGVKTVLWSVTEG